MKSSRKKKRRKDPELFINRELSWLAFNSRVLEEALDADNPLLERLKFAMIVSSNLDEFFIVRVARLKHAVAEGDPSSGFSGLTPRQQLDRISVRAHDMVERLYKTLMEGILPALAERGIRIQHMADLEPGPRMALSQHFHKERTEST